MTLLMLDTATVVNSPSYTPPGDGESEPTVTKATRAVNMRIQIQPMSEGDYVQLPEGKRAEATHKGFADADAALVEGEFVGVAAGEYANYRWEIVHVNPCHGHHFEVAMKRRHDLQATEDPLV